MVFIIESLVSLATMTCYIFIVTSEARDSISKSIRFLWYTQWPTLPVLIIPELGGGVRCGAVRCGGVQILCDRTPPRRLEIFKKRLLRMNGSSRQMVYVNFQNPTCPRDFPGTDFLILV